jgi:hypothetical protein
MLILHWLNICDEILMLFWQGKGTVQGNMSTQTDVISQLVQPMTAQLRQHSLSIHL